MNLTRILISINILRFLKLYIHFLKWSNMIHATKYSLTILVLVCLLKFWLQYVYEFPLINIPNNLNTRIMATTPHSNQQEVFFLHITIFYYDWWWQTSHVLRGCYWRDERVVYIKTRTEDQDMDHISFMIILPFKKLITQSCKLQFKYDQT